jgi:hypothetical protein
MRAILFDGCDANFTDRQYAGCNGHVYEECAHRRMAAKNSQISENTDPAIKVVVAFAKTMARFHSDIALFNCIERNAQRRTSRVEILQRSDAQ